MKCEVPNATIRNPFGIRNLEFRIGFWPPPLRQQGRTVPSSRAFRAPEDTGTFVLNAFVPRGVLPFSRVNFQ
jgi:hypothetical protein